jgi:hypothetical protein
MRLIKAVSSNPEIRQTLVQTTNTCTAGVPFFEVVVVVGVGCCWAGSASGVVSSLEFGGGLHAIIRILIVVSCLSLLSPG